MKRGITHLDRDPEHDPLLKLISGGLRVKDADTLLEDHLMKISTILDKSTRSSYSYLRFSASMFGNATTRSC